MPAPPPPPLRPWSRAWRYLLVIGVGLFVWAVVGEDLIPDASSPLPEEVLARINAAILLDLALGAIGAGLLPLRRRYPVVVASVTALLTSFSGSAVAPASLAAVSMSTWRRWRGVVVTGVAWVGAGAVYEGLYRPSLPVLDTIPAMIAAGLVLVVYAACVATGFYIGARRELLTTLRDRAETAEREQVLKADAAREAERTRIAREMHDVLAHRISLVAMHAGALTYRTDLTPQETAQTAKVIQDNAHGALTELRHVLGVLRTDDAGPDQGPALPEPPQPSLRELPALLAENAEAGTQVDLDVTGMPQGEPPAVTAALGAPPATLSRTVFRVVQEVLTNARKHAPGATVTLRLAGEPGGSLHLEAYNPVPDGARPGLPGAGMGLTGLQERAALAGGTLTHGVDDEGRFVVTATLPWGEA
ncbi:sensor histidine kinase [Cellulomonas bogoriensis]|uniref:histidine kinase n=1 Tax=Cellulomonas bogoriensis 69B4 = DSM 16987 TaxID=1386082 RepID=A0A0A0BYB2_9CELL|nr:histidine kinase [Cellulomonas bogoriensis]KGM13378.1 histidine kinase [Cellulomonas bogoriensis 69B4 = DSM 16987]